MKQISSTNTKWYKIGFPALWFGFLGFFVLISVAGMISSGKLEIMFVIHPIFMAAMGFLIFKIVIGDIVDEVYEKEDSLFIKNKKKSVEINFLDIRNVNYSHFSSPQKVTLDLRIETEFGKKISFVPIRDKRFFAFLSKENKNIEALIERIDQSKIAG